MLIEAARSIHVEEIRSVGALEEITLQWSALWNRCDAVTPFQSPCWLLPWWKHIGGEELCVVTLWIDDQLVGIAPFFIWPSPNARTLLLIGTGISDYLDVLVDPEWKDVAANAIFSWLASEGDRWDVCDFQELRDNSLLLRAAAPDGYFDETSAQSVCPVIDLATAGYSMRRKAQRYLRHAKKLGELHIEQANQQSFEEFFDALLRLHDRRWQPRGGTQALTEEKLEDFHREAARSFLGLGLLRLYVLKLNDRIIGALYGYEAKQRVYYYLGGFDPQFAKLSPGVILIGHAIEQAIASGVKEFDFLRGQEPYKYQWGAKDRKTY